MLHGTLHSNRNWALLTRRGFSTKPAPPTAPPTAPPAPPVMTEVNGMLLRRFEQEEGSEARPIAVVVGWMGSKDSQLKRYLTHYHELGFDTLSFAVGPKHILFPEMAMDQMKNVLDTLLTAKDQQLSSPDVLFHSFSVGGFLFGQCLRCMESQPDTYGQYKSLIKAQIFDSPPDMGSIAFGISKGINLPVALEKPVEGAVNLFLKATENTSGKHYEASRQAFYRNEAQSPALWFYSRADPISRWQDCEYVWKRWQEQGQDVHVQSFEDTPHIQHGRLHPDLYFGKINEFLKVTDFKHHVA